MAKNNVIGLKKKKKTSTLKHKIVQKNLLGGAHASLLTGTVFSDEQLVVVLLVKHRSRKQLTITGFQSPEYMQLYGLVVLCCFRS